MNLTLTTKLIAAGALTLTVVVGVRTYNANKEREASARVEALTEENKRINQSSIALTVTINNLKDEIKGKEVDIANLRTKIANLPKPKPPIPLPPEPEAQISYFKGLHMEPVVVAERPGFLAFPPSNLPAIGQGLQDTQALAGMSVELRDTELLVEKLDGLGSMKDRQISQGELLLGNCEQRVVVGERTVENLKIELKATKRKSLMDKILWGVAGIGVGFLAKR